LIATVLLQHRSDLDPAYWKFVIGRFWREADIRWCAAFDLNNPCL